VKDERFDLEGELHAGRSQPRAEFATSLAADVRGRVRRSRIGLTLALAGLMIVAVASFGGLGYAASNKPVKLSSDTSSASAQYNNPSTKQEEAQQAKQEQQAKAQTKVEPAKQAKQAKQAVNAAATAPAPKAAPAATSSQLPFTGLALWVPLAIGLMLIAFGVVLRTRAKRRPSAH
jgi:uncharacterized protein HemX